MSRANIPMDCVNCDGAPETVVIEAPSVFAMPVIVVPSEIETWRALHHPARARRRYPPEGGPHI